MTRVVAGSAKGITLRVPPKGTRPTTEMVREAIFSHLGKQIENANVLDLFAGSGALGIEALSRQAKTASFVDNGRGAAQSINTNLRSCGFSKKSRVVNASATQYLTATKEIFDVVFLDPPYNIEIEILESVFSKLENRVHEESVIILERSTRSPDFKISKHFEIYKEKRYGETLVQYLQIKL